MKSITNGFILIIFIMVVSCQQRVPARHSLSEIETAYQNGQLSFAIQWADSLLKKGTADSLTTINLTRLVDMVGRIRADFTLKESEIEIRLKKEFREYSQNERASWEKNNWLEYRIIDGEKRYFSRAIPNLKLILTSQQFKQKGVQELSVNKLSLFCIEHTRKVINSGLSNGKPVVPVKMKITYRLTVKPDAVPDGETIRCWLPWPREVHDRQGDVVLLKTVPDQHFIAPDTNEQRSVYLELPASKGKPVEFEIQFTYRSMAQYFDLKKLKILPYDTTSGIFKKYTEEQYPQIVFTNQIKQLSDSIIGGISNPAEKVRRLYYWINDHIIWTGALEYSIMPFR